MDRLLEYSSHHPYLVGATAIVAILALLFETRVRTRSATAVGIADAVRLQNKGALVVDVRKPEQFAAGHIIEARNIANDTLGQNLESLKKYREKPLIVICETGTTSADAARFLKMQGFSQVVNLRGGLAAWRQDNLPLVTETAKGKESKKS